MSRDFFAPVSNPRLRIPTPRSARTRQWDVSRNTPAEWGGQFWPQPASAGFLCCPARPATSRLPHFFMKFRGPKALSNRRQNPIVCPTVAPRVPIPRREKQTVLTLKYLFEIAGLALLAAAAAILLQDLYRLYEQSTLILNNQPRPDPVRPRWRPAGRIAGVALGVLLTGLSIQVVPAGMAGVRVSQISGTLPGTLYPGLHLVLPLVQRIELYDVRDQIFLTTVGEKSAQPLRVQTREGLSVGLAVAVRYRIDAKRLSFVNANLPQPVDKELVPPVVSTAFREAAANHLVRDLFATRREEIRREAAGAIASKLAPDAILVKEVMLRDIDLPAEYAKGLEGVLLKEQENDRLSVEVEVKQKEVRTAELEAEADKARQVKAAEAEAQVTVLQAKAQSDAMQYTLPLKQKQIEQ